MWVGSLGWEDPLEEEMATHSSILTWRIPWAEEPGGGRRVLWSMGSQRVRLSTKHKHCTLGIHGHWECELPFKF